MPGFVHRERVRFGDLDAMHHVNNAVFLRYFESARISSLGELQVHDPVAEVEAGFGLIFAECQRGRLVGDFGAPGPDDKEESAWLADSRPLSPAIAIVTASRDHVLAPRPWPEPAGRTRCRSLSRP